MSFFSASGLFWVYLWWQHFVAVLGMKSHFTQLSRDMTKSTKWVASSKESDQPWHLPSLIRVFAVRMKKAWVLSYPLSALRRLWSDWADAQADLSLHWAHTHFVGFVMSRLILLQSWGWRATLHNCYVHNSTTTTHVAHVGLLHTLFCIRATTWQNQQNDCVAQSYQSLRCALNG